MAQAVIDEEPGGFDEAKLRQDILDTSFGLRQTLDPGTYYVRKQVFFQPSHLLQAGVYKPLKIVGHTESVTGNFDGQPGNETKTVYNTRIVAGIPVYFRHWK